MSFTNVSLKHAQNTIFSYLQEIMLRHTYKTDWHFIGSAHLGKLSHSNKSERGLWITDKRSHFLCTLNILWFPVLFGVEPPQEFEPFCRRTRHSAFSLPFKRNPKWGGEKKNCIGRPLSFSQKKYTNMNMNVFVPFSYFSKQIIHFFQKKLEI